MASSSRHGRTIGLGLCLAILSAGCSAGVGEGAVTGPVWAPGCGLDGGVYDMRSNFYAADPTLDFLSIRVQRGSDFEDVSDGLDISVRSASEVAGVLGSAIALEDPFSVPRTNPDDRPLVAMSLYLNETCPVERGTVPVSYRAVQGSITFDAIYAQSLPHSDLAITGHFEDVRFEDTSSPEERHATLSGHFSFIFNRGRPAQRFP